MKKIVCFCILLLSLCLSVVGNIMPQIQSENWIYSDASGVHVVTDYYKADSNSTGELTFKFLNDTEVASGFRYVRRDSLTKSNPVTNPSFDSGSGMTLYNWTASPLGSGHTVTRDTADFRSGSASLRIVTKGLNSYSYVKNDKIYPFTKDVYYKLSFWAKSNTTSSINAQVRITTLSVTDAELRHLLISAHTSFTTSWTKFTEHRFTRLTNKEVSFKIYILYEDRGQSTDVHIDDIGLEKWSMTETLNTTPIATSFTSSGTTATIVNSFSLSSVLITRRFYVEKTSPIVKAECQLTYPTTNDIGEEYMRFVVNDKSGWMTVAENLRFVDMATENNTVWFSPKEARNFADKWTQKIALFSNNFAFVGADSSWGWFFERDPNQDQTTVDYVIDSLWTHFYLNRLSYPDMIDSSLSFKSHTGETTKIFVHFSVGYSYNKDTYPILMRQPYGYLSTWTITDHADRDEIRRMKALMFGNETLNAPVNGSGFAGLRLPITLSVFPYSTAPATPLGLNNATWLTFMRTLHSRGFEIVPHSLTNSEYDMTNSSTEERLANMDEFHSKTWIDHGGIYINLHCYGWNANNPNNYYILPQLISHGYKYSWDWSDFGSGINVYDLEAYILFTPPFVTILRPHSQTSSILEFATLRSGSTLTWLTNRLTELTSPTRLTNLIEQRGILIAHTYITATNYDTYHIKIVDNKYHIADTLASQLNTLYQKVYSTREIWVASISEILDYVYTLRNVIIVPDVSESNKYMITTSEEISGLTLNFLTNIESSTIDGTYVIGILGSRLYLPTLSPGTHTLKVNFGTLSPSLPRIYDTDERTIFGYYSRDRLTFTVGPVYSGETSATKIYVGDKGEPREVYASNGNFSWSYAVSSKMLEVKVSHLGPAEIIVDWRMPGDVNADGVVNIFDAAKISAHWYPGPPIGPLGYDLIADINYDGAVDILDAAIVNAYWTGPPKGPQDP